MSHENHKAENLALQRGTFEELVCQRPDLVKGKGERGIGSDSPCSAMIENAETIMTRDKLHRTWKGSNSSIC